MSRADEAISETPGPALSEQRPTPRRSRRAVVAGVAHSGPGFLQQQAARLPNAPGVYRMLDAKGEVLYVGKAKSLRKRVPAYAKPAGLSARLQRMVSLTRGLEVVTTASDVEALLLECNMIKRHRPPFNIVLRDDKSFPYIYVGKTSEQQPFPRIGRHRGAKRKDCDYFGPFASSGAVNETLSALLRARGPACSTRSSAARRPASAASSRTTMPSSSSRPAPSCPAAATRSGPSCRRRCGRRARIWLSSRQRRSATG
jgi:hypothetical protein